jgi:hypothetical protein
MGTGTLTVATDGTIIPATDHNELVDALKDNFVPRDTTSKAAVDLAGDLGATSYRWKDAYVQKIVLGLIASGLTIEEDSGDIIFKRDSVEKLRITSTGVDGSDLVAASVGTTQLTNGGVTTAKIADANVTQAKLGAANYAVSATSGAYATVITTYVPVTNLSVTITTTGRPVMLMLVGDGSGPTASIGYSVTATFPIIRGDLLYKRDSTGIATKAYIRQSASSTTTGVGDGLDFTHLDPVGAGTYTYSVESKVDALSSRFTISYYKLVAFEL